MKIKTKRGARRIRNQRVISKRFVTTNYNGNPSIKEGKLYSYNGGPRYGDIIDKNNQVVFIVLDRKIGCAHLHGKGYWQWGSL